MLNTNNHFTQMKELIEKRAIHPYLNKYLVNPYIDDDKLLLLLGLFSDLEITESECSQYTVSTMLVQIALDTHELVSNSDEKENNSHKARQLTVLAGDYYSGLYYQLLAESENISLIKILASAIKEINEHKILLYQKSIEEVPALLDSLKVIESALIGNIADTYHQPVWKEAAGNLLLLKRLIKERKQFLDSGDSILFESLRHILGFKSSLLASQREAVIKKLDQCIIEVQNSTIKATEKLSANNDMLKKRVNSIMEHSLAANFLVEEG